jgi:hypothetical protein
VIYNNSTAVQSTVNHTLDSIVDTHNNNNNCTGSVSVYSLSASSSHRAQGKPVIIYSRHELIKIRNNSVRSIINITDRQKIQELGIKKKRGKRGNGIRIKKRRPKDRNSGVHTELLRTLKKVPLDQKHTHEKCMAIAVVNTRSIRNKADQFLHHCHNTHIDICGVTESWLTDNDDPIISSLTSDCYRFLHANRQNKRGGGVGLLVSTAIETTLNGSENKNSFEYAEWIVKNKQFTIMIAVIYRPPSLSFSLFIDEFSDYLSACLSAKNNIVIMGDFNIKVNAPEDTDTIKFMELLNSFDLKQHVKCPTHVSGNTLDLIITKAEMSFSISEPTESWYISDHCFVDANLGLKKPVHQIKEVTFRKIRNIDQSSFTDDLTSIVNDLSEIENIEVLTDEYNKRLAKCLDKHAPLKTKQITVRKKLPWYSQDILNTKKKKRRAEKKWRSNRNSDTWSVYKGLSVALHNNIVAAKWNYLNGEIIQNAKNPKKLYTTMFHMLGKKKENPLPEMDNKIELCESFADYFLNKIQLIRDELENEDIYITTEEAECTLDSFTEVSEELVQKVMSSMKATCCVTDPCPTSLIKQHGKTMIPLITRLVNLTFLTGNFPLAWKNAIVTPLIKKIGMSVEMKSYRPVNNLPFVSKVAEKCMLHQLNGYMDSQSLLPDYLSAYRSHRSTETVLIRLHNDVLMTMEKQEVMALAAIDLSAAFDTVDHQTLLNVLHKRLGVADKALKWIENYLRPRSFQVQVNGTLSSKRELNFSVPQGSCAGPVLYNIYVSTLEQDIKHYCMGLIGYADDQLTYRAFKAGSQASEIKTVSELEKCLADINSWMSKNRLKMNPGKTEFILFGSRQQLKKCETSSIEVCGVDVKRSSCIKFLGAWLDEELNMKRHISEVTRRCNNTLHNILQIKKYLTKDALSQLVLSLVISKLDYVNALFVGLPDSAKRPLKNTQHFAAKILTGRSKMGSNSKALNELHWLPLDFRVQYKIITTVYKCLKGDAPDYLSNLIQHKVSKRVTRSAARHDLFVPTVKYKTFAGRAFSVQGPEMWNTLPVELQKCSDYDIFKKEVKTFLFKKAFSL